MFLVYKNIIQVEAPFGKLVVVVQLIDNGLA